MTAVEWLYERLERMIPRTELYNIDKKEYFKQAKEMEKEQIIEAFAKGSDEESDHHGFQYVTIDAAEQYYNETFKSE